MSAGSVPIRRCAHFKDLPACLDASNCDPRILCSEFLNYISIVTAVICGVGILNNISCLSALLFRQKFMRDTTYRLVVTGSSVDLLIVLTGFFIGLEFSLPYSNTERKTLTFGVLRRSTCTIISCLHLYRTWVALLIGLERYLLVSKPFFFRTYWKRNTVNILILACAVLVMATKIPLILNVVFDLNTRVVCTPLANSMNVIIDLLFRTLIPMLILPLMSVGVYLTLRKSFRWRGKAVWMIPASVKQGVCKTTAKSVHKAMISVLFIYIFFTIPTIPYGMLKIIIWSKGITRRRNMLLAKEILETIANLSSFLISSVDFYIYLLCWPKFRKTFLQLLPKNRKKEETYLEDSERSPPMQDGRFNSPKKSP
ncbi:hypothetical protein Aperf_G00000106720 [Anoplocephala perfoliata]